MTKVRFPDFHIVGAPKTGTSALTFYLLQHPQIYMGRKDASINTAAMSAQGDPRSIDAAIKDFVEFSYFGSDLVTTHNYERVEDYLAYFSGARANQIIGETSVMYLGSTRAAQEIHAANPDAKIIAIPRDPVDLLPSLQNERQFRGHRGAYGSLDELSLGEEGDAPRPVHEWYGSVCRFAEHVTRYFDVFGQGRVLVLFQEEMKVDTLGSFREVCRFLGVDPDCRINVLTVNRRKKIGTPVQRLWTTLRRLGLMKLKHLLPLRAQNALRRQVHQLSLDYTDKTLIDEATELRLRDAFRDEVERLEEVIGRPVP